MLIFSKTLPTEGHLTPPEDDVFSMLKEGKRPYFGINVLKHLGKPYLHHLQKYQNVQTSKNILKVI